MGRKSWRKMAFLLSPSVLGLAAVAGLVIYLLFFSKPKLPPGTKKLPGPKGIPLLGSVPDLPAKHSWLQFYAWTKQYGPICQVKLGADTCVLVQSPTISSLSSKRFTSFSAITARVQNQRARRMSRLFSRCLLRISIARIRL